MLEFNPYLRITAKDALKSTLFDCIRVPLYEKPCPVQLDHEIFSEGVMDYERGECARY